MALTIGLASCMMASMRAAMATTLPIQRGVRRPYRGGARRIGMAVPRY